MTCLPINGFVLIKKKDDFVHFATVFVCCIYFQLMQADF